MFARWLGLIEMLAVFGIVVAFVVWDLISTQKVSRLSKTKTQAGRRDPPC